MKNEIGTIIRTLATTAALISAGSLLLTGCEPSQAFYSSTDDSQWIEPVEPMDVDIEGFMGGAQNIDRVKMEDIAVIYDSPMQPTGERFVDFVGDERIEGFFQVEQASAEAILDGPLLGDEIPEGFALHTHNQAEGAPAKAIGTVLDELEFSMLPDFVDSTRLKAVMQPVYSPQFEQDVEASAHESEFDFQAADLVGASPFFVAEAVTESGKRVNMAQLFVDKLTSESPAACLDCGGICEDTCGSGAVVSCEDLCVSCVMVCDGSTSDMIEEQGTF